MDELISRQALLDDTTRFMDAFYCENGEMMYSDHILNEADCNDLKEWIKSFPPVTVQANKEDIHREREQAYMRGYEDASRKYRIEPCDDAVSRKSVQETITDSLGRGQNMHQLWQKIEDLPQVTVQEKPNRSKFEFDEEQEQIDFVQPHKKIKMNLVKFDAPYTDAISRQAAIDAMREETCGCCWDARDILKHLPAVITEKTGHWIFVQYEFDSRIGNWHCSECRNILVYAVKKDEVGGIPIAKYCPNCGAKMGVEV